MATKDFPGGEAGTECADPSHKGACPNCGVPTWVVVDGVHLCPKCKELFTRHPDFTTRHQAFLDHLKERHGIDLWRE